MIIYRVENEEGYGPYIGQINSKELLDQLFAHEPPTHPGPWRESEPLAHLNGRVKPYKFGFKSMRSLYAWFWDELPLLEEEGYTVVEKEVEDWRVLIGKSQVAYLPTNCIQHPG